MIAITIDIDWAPDVIVHTVMGVIDRFGVPATLFCTDFTTDRSGNSSSLELYVDRHEIAVHPNFRNTGNYEAVLDSILRLYPSAKGFRSHDGLSGWPIAVAAAQRGVRYEAYCTVYPVYVPPFKINRDVLDYHIFTNSFFDSQMLTVKDFDWSFKSTWFAKELADPNKIFVLGFHPNILYYDMVSVEEYTRRKPTYHTVAESDSFLRKPVRGAMKFLLGVIQAFPVDIFTTPTDFALRCGLWHSSVDLALWPGRSG